MASQLFSYDSLSTVWTNRDDTDASLQEVLQECYVVLELLWELILGSKLSHIGLPTLELLINWFYIVNLVWEVSSYRTILQLISHASLDGIEAIYSTYRWMDESRVKCLARKYELCITGGSDFHGSNKPDIDLGIGRGNLKIPYELWTNLKHHIVWH